MACAKRELVAGMTLARIKSNLSAIAVGKFVLLVRQVVVVPLLLQAWGAETYGSWLVLSTIPSMLTIAKFGIARTASTQITIDLGNKNEQAAMNCLLSGLLTLVTIIIAVLCSMFFLPWSFHALEKTIAIEDAQIIVFVLMGGSLLQMLAGPFEGFYIANRRASAGLWIQTWEQLAQLVVCVSIIASGLPPLTLAIGTEVTRVLGRALYAMHSQCPLNKLCKAKVDLNSIRLLVSKGMGFQLGAVWQAVYFQGTVLLAAAIFGPVGAATWGTLRTVARAGNQLLDLMQGSVFPEVRLALSEGDLRRLQLLHNNAFSVTLILASINCLVLSIVGPWLYSIWTGGELEVPYLVWPFLGLGILLNALWQTSAMIPLARNQPWLLNVPALIAAIFSIATILVLNLRFNSILIFPAGALVFEAIVASVLLWYTSKFLEQNLGHVVNDFRNCVVASVRKSTSLESEP